MRRETAYDSALQACIEATGAVEPEARAEVIRPDHIQRTPAPVTPESPASQMED